MTVPSNESRRGQNHQHPATWGGSSQCRMFKSEKLFFPLLGLVNRDSEPPAATWNPSSIASEGQVLPVTAMRSLIFSMFNYISLQIETHFIIPVTLTRHNGGELAFTVKEADAHFQYISLGWEQRPSSIARTMMTSRCASSEIATGNSQKHQQLITSRQIEGAWQRKHNLQVRV
jgi:hypothetical protein